MKTDFPVKIDRRRFVACAAAIAVAPRLAFANPLGLPAGIQLYSVRDQMKQDLDMALAGVAAAGFKEVESAALPKKSAKEIRSALDKAGLKCVSSHHGFADINADPAAVFAYDAELGSKFIICASPAHRDPTVKGATFSLDDWKFCAENFNRWADAAEKHGLKLGYHNHIHEFDVVDGTSPYELLLKECDPKKMTFEMDCGWVRVAKQDPIALMEKHPFRFSMLHVKDFHLTTGGEAKVTELGKGDIDYVPLFAQARKNQHIQHAFVEQEAFDMPWQQSLKIDADYLRGLH
ncbi:MAG TPA: sugar phosphate isomerase/epimerase [Acidobacteriaceae bacterium]|jgi:sugar phosphate isomerase/epimerase